jgi:hypothetical protein
MKRDVVYVMLASALPAAGNFVAVALALRYLDAEWLGKSYALIAFNFVSIDLFNFGSPRIFTVKAVHSRVSTLIFMDCISAFGSAVVFTTVGTLLEDRGLLARTQFSVLMTIAPICYGLSHFSLGALRFYGRSGMICAISTLSALSRVLVVVLLVVHQSLVPYFPDLLLLIEAMYGVMLLVAYGYSLRRGAPHDAEFFPSETEKFRLLRFEYKTFFRENQKAILGSWYGNAIFSGAKHVDVVIVTFVAGPVAGSLYRGMKSVHNLAFNCGQGVALVLGGRIKHSGTWLFRMSWGRVLAAVVALLTLVSCSSLLACRVRLFPIAVLGSETIQLSIMFAAFLGATLIFLCRVLSLFIFSTDRASFVGISTLEVSSTLLLVSILSYGFGLLGALTGIAITGALVLALSLRMGGRAARHSMTVPCAAGRTG